MGKLFKQAEYFTGWLSPRAINGLGDHFEFGLLPKIRGLYTKEQLAFTDCPYLEPEVNAIFLSHAHFDHVAHICFVDPPIPVYLGVGTKLFLESMEETSSFCDYKEHEYRTFRSGKKIKIDDITVEPVHVDHSIPAAYGFIIHASEATIVYTGDLRVHGSRKDLTEEFMERAKIRGLVSDIGARKIFPVHTENSYLFKRISRNVQLIEREKGYRI